LGSLEQQGIQWFPDIGKLLTQSQLLKFLKRAGVHLAEWTTDIDPQETILEIEQSRVFVLFKKRRMYQIRYGDSFKGPLFLEAIT
jgi:hypothetical protein